MGVDRRVWRRGEVREMMGEGQRGHEEEDGQMGRKRRVGGEKH